MLETKTSCHDWQLSFSWSKPCHFATFKGKKHPRGLYTLSSCQENACFIITIQCMYIYRPGIEITLVLIGKDVVLKGSSIGKEDKPVPGRKDILVIPASDQPLVHWIHIFSSANKTSCLQKNSWGDSVPLWRQVGHNKPPQTISQITFVGFV